MSEDMEPLAATLHVEAKGDGTEATVIVEGELDKSGATGFLACVREAIDIRPVSVAVDARGLTFMDSSGLRSLLVARAVADETGVAFRIRQPSPTLRHMVERTGLRALLLDE
jgi:anti-anti-sigma factor